MSKYTHLASLVFNKPLLVTQDYAETIAVVLSDRLDLNVEGMSIKNDPRDARPTSTQQGIAVIPIVGSMSHRTSGMEAMSGMQSYASLQQKFEQAFNDPNISSILMDIDSPGGSVAGAFDFRDYLMENKGRKPMYALARDNMCSAAYLIGSTADKLYATQTARVGSIGVIAMHTDMSEKNKKDGIKPTFITAGDFKAAGNPHEKLEGAHLDYIQESVNQSYEMFIDAVAGARGLDKKVIRDTQARVYGGKEAVKIGLADGIRTYESVLKEMSAPGFNTQKGMKMTEQTDIEKLAADVADLQATATKLRTDNETLRAQVLAAGFKITSEGLTKPDVTETMEIDGEVVELAGLPDSVVKTLKAKADNDLTALATAEYPNLQANVAKKLYVAFQGDDEMKAAINAFNTKMGTYLEEKGDTAPALDTTSAQEKFDSLVKAKASADGMTYHAAYAAVANTPDGKQLIQDIYKEKE